MGMGVKKEVVIFRGFQGWLCSTGMDMLCDKIKREIPEITDVTVDGYENWMQQFNRIKTSPNKLILIGHSFGALAAYKVVSMLNKKKIDLVASFDYSPYYSGIVGSPSGIVPGNVVNSLNFYQKIDPLVRGVVMKRADDTEYGIKNIKSNHIHVMIDKIDEYHKEVIDAIRVI